MFYSNITLNLLLLIEVLETNLCIITLVFSLLFSRVLFVFHVHPFGSDPRSEHGPADTPHGGGRLLSGHRVSHVTQGRVVEEYCTVHVSSSVKLKLSVNMAKFIQFSASAKCKFSIILLSMVHRT